MFLQYIACNFNIEVLLCYKNIYDLVGADMRKHIKKIVIILLAAIVLCACLWRLLPHSFADIISVDESAISSLACTANISGLNNDSEPFIDNYELQALTDGSKDFTAIIDLLNRSEYQKSFQNLLPWAITSVRSSGSSMNANIFLTWGSTEKETCFLTVLGDGKVVVSLGKSNGFFVYHATDHSMLEQLVNYIQENGTKN